MGILQQWSHISINVKDATFQSCACLAALSLGRDAMIFILPKAHDLKFYAEKNEVAIPFTV